MQQGDNGDARTLAQRAEDKCVYWAAQVQWWERWANEHDLNMDTTGSASVHLAFMRGLATQAAEEQRDTTEPTSYKAKAASHGD